MKIDCDDIKFANIPFASITARNHYCDKHDYLPKISSNENISHNVTVLFVPLTNFYSTAIITVGVGIGHGCDPTKKISYKPIITEYAKKNPSYEMKKNVRDKYHRG